MIFQIQQCSNKILKSTMLTTWQDWNAKTCYHGKIPRQFYKTGGMYTSPFSCDKQQYNLHEYIACFTNYVVHGDTVSTNRQSWIVLNWIICYTTLFVHTWHITTYSPILFWWMKKAFPPTQLYMLQTGSPESSSKADEGILCWLVGWTTEVSVLSF